MTERTYETAWIVEDTKTEDGLVRKPKLPVGIMSFRVVKDDGVNCVVVAEMDDTQNADMLKYAEAKLLAETDILANKKTDTQESIDLIEAAKLAEPIKNQPIGVKG